MLTILYMWSVFICLFLLLIYVYFYIDTFSMGFQDLGLG